MPDVPVDVLHCPTCGSEDLSRPASYYPFETYARFSGAGKDGKDVVVSADQARVCLACGALALFVSERMLARVRELERD